MVRRIPIGDFALVDDKDEDMVSSYSWSKHSAGYAVAYDPETKNQVLMHRLILGLQKGDGNSVDHINGDRLDNRRENLRVTDQASNSLNRWKNPVGDNSLPSSPYKGVYWLRERQKWGTQFRGEHIGVFDNDLDAAKAYDEAVRRHDDRYARVNFEDPAEAEYAPSQTIPRKGAPRPNSISKYRGVSWNKQKKVWTAQIRANGIRVTWHTSNEQLAARWYDVLASAILGTAAFLNFPGEPLVVLPINKQRHLDRLLKVRGKP